MHQVDMNYPAQKEQMYELLTKQVEAILEGESDVIANLSNVSALLNEALSDINWVGFYLMKNDELILGPFQGKLACVHIKIGKGVCGTAVATKRTQLVENVHEFPGHIACDCRSNSEIVVPIVINEKVFGVLDVDSPLIGRFDQTDLYYLEKIIEIIIEHCNWSACGKYDFNK